MTGQATPTLGARIVGFVELARPPNVVMAAIGTLIGALVAGGPVLSAAVGLAALATGLVTAGGNALNDVTDRSIDARAHPQRPIPSGRVPARAAMALAAASFGIALAVAWWIDPVLFLVVVAAEAVLLVYEAYLKASGLAGNLVVAGLVAATFVAGALAVGRPGAPVGFLAGLSFLANVGREVWKDAEDAPHDEGRRTVAQRWGQPAAHRLAQAATLAAVVLSPLPFLVGYGGWPFLVTVLLADVGFLAAVLASEPARAQRSSKLSMIVALAAFGMGGIL